MACFAAAANGVGDPVFHSLPTTLYPQHSHARDLPVAGVVLPYAVVYFTAMTLATEPTSCHAALTTQPPPLDDVAAADLYRFSVEEYHERIRSSFFDADDSLELLEGLLVRKMSEDRIHAAVVYALLDLLREMLPGGYIVRGPAPVTTADSEPEPDLVIVRGKQLDYADHHPDPADALLLIEVANSSLSRDRGWKQRIYAAAGTPHYWIIDLPARAVEVYTQSIPATTTPDVAAHYRTRILYTAGDPIPLPIENVPDLSVAAIFPNAT